MRSIDMFLIAVKPAGLVIPSVLIKSNHVYHQGISLPMTNPVSIERWIWIFLMWPPISVHEAPVVVRFHELHQDSRSLDELEWESKKNPIAGNAQRSTFNTCKIQLQLRWGHGLNLCGRPWLKRNRWIFNSFSAVAADHSVRSWVPYSGKVHMAVTGAWWGPAWRQRSLTSVPDDDRFFSLSSKHEWKAYRKLSIRLWRP